MAVGSPCDDAGNDLPPGFCPFPAKPPETHKWAPFDSQLDFEIADFLYRRNEMPQQQQNELLSLWNATLKTADPNAKLPFNNSQDVINRIDEISHGEVPWDFFDLGYTGEIPDDDPPSWMQQKYRVWFRDALKEAESMLKNRDLDGKFDYVSYKEYDEDGGRRYGDFMSGDWAWKQSVNTLETIYNVA